MRTKFDTGKVAKGNNDRHLNAYVCCCSYNVNEGFIEMIFFTVVYIMSVNLTSRIP